MARRLPCWTALLLPFLLAGVGTSASAAAASPPHDVCPVPTIVESVLGTPDTCSSLDRRLGDPVGVIEVRCFQRCDKIAKKNCMYANLFVPLPYLEVPYNCVDGVETKQMICDANCLA